MPTTRRFNIPRKDAVATTLGVEQILPETIRHKPCPKSAVRCMNHGDTTMRDIFSWPQQDALTVRPPGGAILGIDYGNAKQF